MLESVFTAFGPLFASGAGILGLTALAGLLVLVWDWRLAVAGLFVLHFGAASMLVYLHAVSGLVAAAQMLAVLLAVIMLGGVSHVQGVGPTVRQSGNWLLRMLAMVFLVGSWWFIDPGFALPRFSQPETDYAIWVALCGLLVLCLSDNPLFVACAVLLLAQPSFMIAAVLLPGSGMTALMGIAVILTALACSYLMLAESPAKGGKRGAIPGGLQRFGARIAGYGRPARRTVSLAPRVTLRSPSSAKPDEENLLGRPAP